MYRLAAASDATDRIVAEGALPPLVALCGDASASGDARRCAAMALCNLAASGGNAETVAAAGAIEPLLAMLALDQPPDGQRYAAMTLCNLATTYRSVVCFWV